MKKILFMFLMVLPLNVLGLTYGGCDYSFVSRLKSLVTNINISYDYYVENEIYYFNVTLNNITEDMYFYDVVNNKNYYYSDTNNGEITIRGYNSNGSTGTYKFYSSNKSCYGISLGSKYYKFPTYNYYYNDEICSDVPNYNLCQKWANVNYSREELQNMINEYKNKGVEDEIDDDVIVYKKNWFDNIVDFYVNYYYYLLIAIIVIFSVVIIIKKNKEKIKL